MSFLDISKKQTISAIGNHLLNYWFLYSRPLMVWRKVIGNRKDGYDLLILHLVYYCFFLLLIIKDLFSAMGFTLIEIGITIIPTLIFILPFLLFTRLYRIKIKWFRIFRLFLILKLQFVPIFVICYLLANWLEIESLYIFLENYLWVIWVAFIVVLPLLIKITVWKKIVWILCNYITCLFFMALIFFTLSSISLEGAKTDKLALKTPSNEHTQFLTQYSFPQLIFTDKFYIVVFRKDLPQESVPLITKYVSVELFDYFTKNYINHIDTLSNKAKTYPEVQGITMPILDEYYNLIDKNLRAMVQETKRLKDSSDFESNRQYFSSLYNYLTIYDSSYKNLDLIQQIVSKPVVHSSLDIGNSYVAVMLTIDSSFYQPFKNKYLEREQKLQSRSDKSEFIMNIFIYPVDIILDKMGY